MTQEDDELVKQLRSEEEHAEGPFMMSHRLRQEAAFTITRLNAELAKKSEELEYAKAGIGYAEAAKLLETVDSLTADLASALETRTQLGEKLESVLLDAAIAGFKPNQEPWKTIIEVRAELAKHKKEKDELPETLLNARWD